MTTTDLRGKVAIVTGASKGIGRTLAIGLATRGASVVVNYKHDRSGATATSEAIQDVGGTSIVCCGDVSVRADVRRLVDTAHHKFGTVDVLVNNAGRTRLGPIAQVTEDDWADAVGTNLRGAFFATLAAAQAMERGGSVVNVSSIAASVMLPHHAICTATKAGLEALTRQLAFELAPAVRVNAIAPGATSMQRNWEYDPGFDAGWAEVTPLGRVAKPDDYIGPVAFLASDDSAFVTGQVLTVDGGWTIKGDHPPMDHYDFAPDRLRG